MSKPDPAYIRRVADAVERLDRGEKIGPLSGFHMMMWGCCGTRGCIAGTVCALMIEDGEIGTMPRRVSEAATSRLGLSGDQAYRLFGGEWSSKYVEDITAAEAAAELRRLAAETGNMGESK